MARNTDNVDFWPDAALYVSWNLSATVPSAVVNPATDFATWEDIGVLDGDAGFEETQDHDENDASGWGVGVFHVTHRNYKQSVKFVALEQNTVTDRLRYPNQGSSNRLGIGKPEKVLLAFVKTGDAGSGQRYEYKITAGYAHVTPDGSVTDNETDPVKIPFKASIYPVIVSGKPLHWRRLRSEDLS